VARWEAGFGLARRGFELWGVRGGDGGFWTASSCRIVKVEGPSAERFVGEEVVVCDSIASSGRLLWAQGFRLLHSTANWDTNASAATAHGK
jgi:hypothetical protein